MASKLRFFIVRDEGSPSEAASIVPLIPLDLLPPWIDVQGYPREMGIHQTAGMTSLGTFPREGGHLQLRFNGAPPADNMTGPNSAVALDGSHGDENAPAPAGHDHAVGTALPQLSSSSPSGQARNRRLQPVAPPDMARTRRMYCQAWCHHGVCRHGVRCLRRHEMPNTAESLKAIGLSSYPPWWQERYKYFLHADKKTSEGSNQPQQQPQQQQQQQLQQQQEFQQQAVKDSSLPPPSPAHEERARSASALSQHLEKGEELDQTMQEVDEKASRPDPDGDDLLSFS